jgi:HEAT repeat protein
MAGHRRLSDAGPVDGAPLRPRGVDVVLAVCLVLLTVGCGPSSEPETPPPAVGLSRAVSPELQPIIDLLLDVEADGLQRMEAAEQLAGMGDPDAVPALISALEDDLQRRTGLWAAVIPALGALGDPRAVPVLIPALNDRDDHWLGRTMAAEALGRIGDPSAVPDLIRASYLADTRSAAVTALAAIGDPRAAPVLVEVLVGGDEPEVVAAAERGLLALGEAAVPHLEAALEAPAEAGDRQAVAAALDRINREGSDAP